MAFLPMVWLISTGLTFWRYWPVGDFLGPTHILVDVQITFSLFAASPPFSLLTPQQCLLITVLYTVLLLLLFLIFSWLFIMKAMFLV